MKRLVSCFFMMLLIISGTSCQREDGRLIELQETVAADEPVAPNEPADGEQKMRGNHFNHAIEIYGQYAYYEASAENYGATALCRSALGANPDCTILVENASILGLTASYLFILQNQQLCYMDLAEGTQITVLKNYDEEAVSYGGATDTQAFFLCYPKKQTEITEVEQYVDVLDLPTMTLTRYSVGGYLQQMAVWDGEIYAAQLSNDGSSYLLKTEKQTLFEVDDAAEIYVAGERVYCLQTDRLYCYDLATDTLQVVRAFEGLQNVERETAVFEDRLYVRHREQGEWRLWVYDLDAALLISNEAKMVDSLCGSSYGVAYSDGERITVSRSDGTYTVDLNALLNGNESLYGMAVGKEGVAALCGSRVIVAAISGGTVTAGCV